jgi:hypothetical protein
MDCQVLLLACVCAVLKGKGGAQCRMEVGTLGERETGARALERVRACGCTERLMLAWQVNLLVLLCLVLYVSCFCRPCGYRARLIPLLQ